LEVDVMQEATRSSGPYKRQAHAKPEQPARDYVDVRDLVGPRRQVTISHAGEDYILRITRNGKLILTK
jgi:hemin uptake protein HemP